MIKTHEIKLDLINASKILSFYFWIPLNINKKKFSFFVLFKAFSKQLFIQLESIIDAQLKAIIEIQLKAIIDAIKSIH